MIAPRRRLTAPTLASTALAFVVGCSGGAKEPTAGDASDAGTSAATEEGTSATSTGEGTGTSDGETTAEGTTTGGELLTYYKHTKAIVDAKCATCHRPGDIAPFSLETYEQVAMMAPYLDASIADGTMPPWPPDAACNDYRHDRSLSADEAAVLRAWIMIGAPEGDPADAPPPVEPPPTPDFDLELQAAEPYQPTAIPDDYRCFLFDWPKEEVTYVTAFDIVPGERTVVHHVIAFVIPEDQIATFDKLDAADPDPGYPCYGGPGGEVASPAQWLGAWVPGYGGGEFPEGTGIQVQPGSKIALQIHYHPYNGAPADLSTMRLRTADTVDKPAYLMPLVNVGWLFDQPPMTIPAGSADTVHSTDVGLSGMLNLLFPGNGISGGALLVHGAGVHMHTLGTRGSLSINGVDDPCLVDIHRWDFNWQGVYDLTTPKRVEPGQSLRLECHFDNSAGDKSVKWGEGTGDEMCLGVVYVSAAD
ncbi:MAG: hypothetical protein R3B09_04735 [Nannocystaceae bacterium]